MQNNLNTVVDAISTIKGSLGTDLVYLIVIAAIFAAIGLFLGKEKLASILVAGYPTILIYAVFPIEKVLSFLESKSVGFELSNIAIFGILWFIISFFMSRYQGFSAGYSTIRNWLDIVILAIADTMLVAYAVLVVLKIEKLHIISDAIVRFMSSDYEFALLALPLIALLLIERRS